MPTILNMPFDTTITAKWNKKIKMSEESSQWRNGMELSCCEPHSLVISAFASIHILFHIYLV